jgi:hypothetical protein
MPGRRIKSGDDLLIVGTGFLLVVLVALVWYLLATIKRGNSGVLMAATFYGITIGVPLLVAAALIALIWHRQKFGTASLLLDSNELTMGQSVNGWIEISRPLTGFSSMRLCLACLKLRGGRNQRVDVLWKSEKMIAREEVRVELGKTLIPVALTLPDDGPKNHIWTGGIRWVLDAEALPNRGPHFKSQFSLPVMRRNHVATKAQKH